MINKFEKYVNEELDDSTVGLVGNGTAVTGYPTGSWITSAGVSVSGGDSGTAFAGNSSDTKGLEQEVICPPKDIFKEPKKRRNKKNKKDREYNQVGKDLDELSKPVLKVNEAVTKKAHTFVCQFNTRVEANLIIEGIKKELPKIKVSTYFIGRVNSFPNWLYIDSYYNDSLIQIEPMDDYDSSYEYQLQTVLKDIKYYSDADSHIYNVNELPELIRKLKDYFDFAPTYFPRKIVRTLENLNEGQIKNLKTLVCQYEHIEDAFALIDRITNQLTDISIDVDPQLRSAVTKPNYLIINLSDFYKEIYITYWGEYIGDPDHFKNGVLLHMRNNDWCDKHLYTYNEKDNLIKELKDYFDKSTIPNYLPRKINRTLESMSQKPQLSMICNVKNKAEAIDIANRIKQTIPVSLEITPHINDLYFFPNYLFIDMYYEKNQLQVNIDPGYSYSQELVEQWLGESNYDSHLYEYEELNKLMTNIKTYFNIPMSPNYNPRKTVRTLESINEAVEDKDMLTMICKFDTLEDAHKVISTLEKQLPNIEVDFNESLDDLDIYPNFLFIELNYPDTLYVNYWGDYTHEREVLSDLNAYGHDNHLYNYTELDNLINKVKGYFDIRIAPNYSPRRIVRTLENKLNEGKTKEQHTICCQVENRQEAVAITSMIKKELPKIGLWYYNRPENIQHYPNWLYLDMSYNQSEIKFMAWGEYVSYENALRSVTNDINSTTTADKHLYTYGELSTMMLKIKNYFDVAPTYLPKKIIRTLENKLNEEFYYTHTIICKFNTIQEVHTIINSIRKISPDIKVDYNHAIGSDLKLFPNWLFIDLFTRNEIYVNYWGDSYSDQDTQTQITRSLTRPDYDHHMYTYNELRKLIASIKTHYGIPVVPDYSPRKINRTLENKIYNDMKTFNEFSKLYEDEGSGGVSSATLGNTGGMGAVVSAQPSSVPGDVAGSTIGSGDISRGNPLGPYTKIPTRKSNKKNKKNKPSQKPTNLRSAIQDFYTTKYSQDDMDGRVIQSWKTFTDTH